MAAAFCWHLCCPKCNETASHQWLHLLTHLPASDRSQQPASFYVGIENTEHWALQGRIGHEILLAVRRAGATVGLELALLGLRAPIKSVKEPGRPSRNPGDENFSDSSDGVRKLLGAGVAYGYCLLYTSGGLWDEGKRDHCARKTVTRGAGNSGACRNRHDKMCISSFTWQFF